MTCIHIHWNSCSAQRIVGFCIKENLHWSLNLKKKIHQVFNQRQNLSILFHEAKTVACTDPIPATNTVYTIFARKVILV